MKEFTINKNEAGRRLDQYLFRLLPNAKTSLIYKQLRDKNITVNKKKAAHDLKLNEGDIIQIFFSDQTFEKFSAGSVEEQSDIFSKAPFDGIKIIYEDEDFILVDKPAGILSQTDKSSIPSINEWLIDYLLTSGQIDKNALATFKPAFCNRLDRNTSGLMLGGKSLRGLRLLSDSLKNRTLKKYYKAHLTGLPDDRLPIDRENFTDFNAWLLKDNKNNKVRIYPEQSQNLPKDACMIHTGCRLLEEYTDSMLVEIDLYTGKSHQIRAHMAYLGHPLVGDPKYGNAGQTKAKDGQTKTRQFQELRAYRVVFPKLDDFGNISGREFILD